MALCFSLFASLIHAGSMPASFDLVSEVSAGHVVNHECHTQGDANVEKSHSTSHQTHHQCCLGVIANLTSNQCVHPNLSNCLFSFVPQLTVERFPSHIFKPPRQIS